MKLLKYPRTRHLRGSRLQAGDEDLTAVDPATLAGRHVVVEEKVDGANAALRFDASGRLHLQSRGHYLTGGPRERHFALLKTWAAARAPELREALGERYIAYGEWVYARHTIYYDRLPHYFLEFDVLDVEEAAFLSTPRRRALLAGLPLAAVPVLYEGPFRSYEHLVGMVGPSLYKSPGWRDALAAACAERGVDPERARRETDPSDHMEGLYIKVEEEGRVVGRYKWIRADFLQAVLESGSHWLDRPIVPNRLAPGVEIFG